MIDSICEDAEPSSQSEGFALRRVRAWSVQVLSKGEGLSRDRERALCEDGEAVAIVWLEFLHAGSGVNMRTQMDYAYELLVGEYEWSNDEVLRNLKRSPSSDAVLRVHERERHVL
jgi:hypothetical protein